MAVLLVDYENVYATNGLKGVEHLTSGDTLCIFYSQCCAKIRAEYMSEIENSGCDFDVYKLLHTGKNALDFYIASECGMMSEKGERRIAIISNDKGFSAVQDFFQVKTDSKTMVVMAPNIETALLRLDSGSGCRYKAIKNKSKMLDLGAEQAKYSERKAMNQKIAEVLSGTQYECITNKILEYAGANQQKSLKQLYTGSLHQFGREAGVAIYQILKVHCLK